MERAIAETNRRREKQEAYNTDQRHHARKRAQGIADILESVYEQDHVLVSTGDGGRRIRGRRDHRP